MSKLAARIELLGYSQREVADGARIDRWLLMDYIHRRIPITPTHMRRLCVFLHCEPETIFEPPNKQVRVNRKGKVRAWRGE